MTGFGDVSLLHWWIGFRKSDAAGTTKVAVTRIRHADGMQQEQPATGEDSKTYRERIQPDAHRQRIP